MSFKRSQYKHSQMDDLLFFNRDYATAKDRTYLELSPLMLWHYQVQKVQGS